MKSDFRDFPCQDNRMKVDFQNVETASDTPKHREKDSSESRFVFDLRKSLAWDSAFFDSPGVLDPEELCETLNIQLMDNRSDVNRQGDSESRESARVNRISNLRKSLAWDNAFFTSAGVLDAEELSIVNRGFKRTDLIQFPEEIWQSPESKSTVNTDGYSLASLEIDLFDDIRSSNRNASSNVATSPAKLKREKGKPYSRASTKSNGSSHIQHGAPSGESSSSSHKPPKISSHSNPSRIVPSKRTMQVHKATKSATGKKLCLRESCNVLSSSMSSLKSPSSVLPAARNDHPGLCYASIDLINRSPSNPRRRIDSQMAASVSSFKTPLKYSIKNEAEVLNSSDSTRLFSTPKSSPYTSPGSSMDTSSSEQSLTSIKQRSNSSAVSAATKTSNIDRRNHVQSYFGHDLRETKLLNPRINVSMCSSNSTSTSRKLTPSGLRMPTPKLGYFDSEKSAGLAQNVGLKFHSGSDISSVNGSANGTRYGRNRSAGTSTGSVSKSGKKDEGKNCSNEKHALKEHGNVKASQLGEHNKENVSLENHVRCLTNRIGAMSFSRDSVTPGQRK